jgi:VWFA-related protein
MNNNAIRSTVAVLLPLLLAVDAPSQDRSPKFGAKSYVTAIELVVDVTDSHGKTPSDLTPADFVIVEDGVEREVTSVDYLGGGLPVAKGEAQTKGGTSREEPQRAADWQIVVWFDGITTSRGMLQTSVRDLKKQAPQLVAMGPVTVLYSDLDTKVMVATSRNLRAVNDALDKVLKNGVGDRISRLRQGFVRDSESVTGVNFGNTTFVTNGIGNDIPHFVSEELRLLSISRTNLLRWISRVPRRQPRMLMYVGDGFDLDPVDFYAQVFESTPEAQNGLDLRRRSENRVHLDQQNLDLARALATEGWLTVAVGGTGGYSMTSGVDRQGNEKVSNVSTSNPMPTYLFTAPEAPLMQLARETGGARVASVAQLPNVLERLRNRVRLTYQVDRAPDLQPRHVNVRSRRQGLAVIAPKWSSSSTDVAVMEVRGLDLLDNPQRAEKGDLAIQAYAIPNEGTGVTDRSGTIRARVDLTPLKLVASQIGATKFRFTIAFNEAGSLPSFVHNLMDVADLGKLDAVEWTAPYALPATSNVAAVIVEELTSGAWGSVYVPLDGSMGTPQTVEEPIEATPPEWLTDRDEALARAAREQKIVLVFHRDQSCRACVKLLREAATHPTVQRLASKFVLLAAPLARPAAPGLYQPSTFALLDATGLEPMTWQAEDQNHGMIGVGAFADIMQRADAAAPFVRQSAAERLQGKTVDAYTSLGWAFRQAGDAARASEAYAAGVRAARASGDLQAAQSGEVLYALTEATRGKVQDSVANLRAIARAPISRKTESEAYFALAQLLRASGDERAAAEALERASSDAAATLIAAQETHVVGANTRAIRLLLPARPAYSGTITAEALTRDPSIASVVFTLDGTDVATDARPPFDAKVDLGSVPRRHELRIAARDATGKLVGEDTIVLNERNDEFWVRLAIGERRTATASLNLPAGGTLSKIDFFIDDHLIATKTAPPYTVPVGDTNEGSTLRVAAMLADGRTAEDALLVGIGSELIEVQEVELFVNVVDARDEEVSNLDRSQFTVREENAPRRILGFEYLARAPFTVGLAIDSSSSMLPRIADVHESAREFLSRSAADGNRAFIVDFDTTPKLAAPTASNADALRAAVESIRADGSTALYDAMVFSLLQLQGVSGKRALIVLTDGKDSGSRYTLDDVVRVARESGASIYLVLLATGAPARLNELATETGGRTWDLRDTKQLDAIYSTISRELRSQYRITFQTPARDRNQWRRVSVTTEVPNLKVRTIAGFFPR